MAPARTKVRILDPKVGLGNIHAAVEITVLGHGAVRRLAQSATGPIGCQFHRLLNLPRVYSFPGRSLHDQWVVYRRHYPAASDIAGY